MSAPSLYQEKLIKDSGRPSAHAGCAVDIRWDQPGPGRDTVVREMLPFYIPNSRELHIQAIHDYWGCRVWRANRSHDAAGGWKTQTPGSHEGKMGANWARWLHLEINQSGWDDDRAVEEMLGTGLPGAIRTDLLNGIFGLYPLNRNKPPIKFGDKGDLVLYAQSVIFFKAGGAIQLDSDFGTQTTTRVRDLQRVFGLPESGEINSPAWGAVDFVAVRQ